LPVFLHVQSDEEAALFEPQLSTIVALTKGGKSAKLVRELKDIPEGCGGAVVTPTIAIHTLVRVSMVARTSDLDIDSAA
jgi:valyl-tRNA synthetase